jgi:hypothetical protein
MSQSRREFVKTVGAPLVLAGMGVREAMAALPMTRKTAVSIVGNAFWINGGPTYPGREFRGHRIEGLLFTSRMVNCIIDDQNPSTRGMWDYRDGPWDPERNTNEFIANLPRYRSSGLDAISFNIQGGSLMGYGWHQPWLTSGYTPSGALRSDYRTRLIRVLDAADAVGMVVNLGLFYVNSRPALADEAAIIHATDEVCDLLCQGGYTNVIIEVGNEADMSHWAHDIIQPARSHELVERIQTRSTGRVKTSIGRLLVSTSFVLPPALPERLLRTADYILYHGNSLDTPEAVHERARQIRGTPGYRGQPLLINEDDHFDFDKAENNMLAAIEEYSGWGYFDYRQIRERFEDGYQSLPVDWGINSSRKKAFFTLLAQVTGATAP